MNDFSKRRRTCIPGSGEIRIQQVDATGKLVAQEGGLSETSMPGDIAGIAEYGDA